MMHRWNCIVPPTSVTFRAQEIESGREVALEQVTADTSNPGLRELLESEAEATRQIKQINIPALYDFGFDRGDLIYVTEYFDGHTATAWVTAQGPLAPAAVLHAALQVVAAMDAMAFHRIHHHALNPDNLIFLAGPMAAADWPAVRILHWLGVAPLFAESGDPRLDHAARFASPEQLYTGKVDIRSEIFSLGCTMWFLLTGTAPAGVQSASGEGTSLSLHDLRGVPKIVSHLIGRMLRFEPDERPQDPVALGAYLQTCLTRIEKLERRRKPLPPTGGIGAATTKINPQIVASKPAMSRNFLALAALVIALASLAAFAVPHYLERLEQRPSALKPNRPAPDLQNQPAARSSPVVEQAKNDAKTADDPVVEVPRRTLSAATNAENSNDEPPPPEEGPTGDFPVASASRFTEATGDRAESRPVGRSESASLLLASNKLDQDEARPVAPVVDEDSEGAFPSAPETTAIVPPETNSPESPIVSVPSTGKGKKDHSTVASTKSDSSRPPKARTVARKSSRSKERRKDVSARKIAVKRARPVPELRFGSSRAELVGTTSDGQWILTVDSNREASYRSAATRFRERVMGVCSFNSERTSAAISKERTRAR